MILFEETLLNKFIFEDPFEFKGIRNYTTSDPMKKINWSASAKTGELMVNNYYDTTSRHVTIFLDVVNDSVWKRYEYKRGTDVLGQLFRA